MERNCSSNTPPPNSSELLTVGASKLLLKWTSQHLLVYALNFLFCDNKSQRFCEVYIIRCEVEIARYVVGITSEVDISLVK
jgi:hypothetical protein